MSDEKKTTKKKAAPKKDAGATATAETGEAAAVEERPGLDPGGLAELATSGNGGAGNGISALLDLELPVAVELGRTRLPVQEVLGLGRGSVVQLDRLAGEPVDLYVSDRRFAEGEVVVLGEQFGIRVTRVLGQPGADGAGSGG